MQERQFTIKINQKTIILLSAVLIIAFLSGGLFWVKAAFIEPDFAPSASDQDFAQNILGANSANNEFSSDTVTGNQDGSIIERMEYMADIYLEPPALVNFSLQKNQIYDDWNCANNNEGGTAACAAGDPEYTGEEGAWTAYNDTNLNGAKVASGTVYKDERTGLYWSDCYDSTSGGGSCNTRTNSFTIGTGCSDADINSGLCNNSDYQTAGVSIDFCENLSLDADGDDTDETDWYLPSEKELLQAYINGAANNLPNPDYYYWSSTERSSNTGYAWHVYLAYGSTNYLVKTELNYVRCVRR